MKAHVVDGDVANTLFLGIARALSLIHSAQDVRHDEDTSGDLVERAVSTLMAYKVFYQLHRIPMSNPH